MRDVLGRILKHYHVFCLETCTNWYGKCVVDSVTLDKQRYRCFMAVTAVKLLLLRQLRQVHHIKQFEGVVPGKRILPCCLVDIFLL